MKNKQKKTPQKNLNNKNSVGAFVHFYVTLYCQVEYRSLKMKYKLFPKPTVYKEHPGDNFMNKGDSCIVLLHP